MQAAAAQVSDAFGNGFAQLPPPAAPIENDMSYQVGHLERMVEDGLRNLNIACARMEQVERDLRAFLDEYYAQVGGFFEQLEQLHQEIAAYDRKIAAVRKNRRPMPLSHREDILLQVLRDELPALPANLLPGLCEDEMKAIYHRLVKLYHPDVQPGNRYSTPVLQLINEAYAKRSLWAMRAIEHSLVEHAMARQDTPERKVTRLRERFDAICESAARAAYRRKWLESTEAWQLKKRTEQDRYLIEVIIHRTKQQIESAKRTLAHKKIEHRVMAA